MSFSVLMLIIGDIHIHPRYGTLTLETLREFIHQHPTEHIVFLGDYVYHFSYHRASLFALLELFLELAQEHKHVYILAGNHDRLGQHFVYGELEKFLTIHNHDYLHLITTPQQHIIYGQTFLFVPYLLSRSWYTPQQISYPHRPTDLRILQTSSVANERDSYLLNAYLDDTITTLKSVTIIHHYYTAQTKFPQMYSQFSYKDKAISPHFLENSTIRLISGHIHHGFCYHNYLCLGAVRSTSPLETNILQRLAQYDHTKNHWHLHQIAINPYLTIAHDNDMINDTTLESHWETLQDRAKQAFDAPLWSLELHYCSLPLTRTSLTIQSNNLSYEQIDTAIGSTLRTQLRDFQLKQLPVNMDLAIQELVDSTQDFQSSRSHWKGLLHDYLDKKYGDKKSEYLTLLDELDISV